MKPTPSNLRVVAACPLGWSAMRGDEQQHYCQLCRVSVQNLSLLSDSQKAALAAEVGWGAHFCVAYLQRSDGNIITRPRWWPLWLWRLWWQLVSGFGRRRLPLGFLRRLGQPVMGRVAVRPEPPPRA